MIRLTEYEGAHALQLRLGDLYIWFSYETVVAFKEPGRDTVVCDNTWGNTTGKHINAIDGGGENKKHRLLRSQFENELNAMLARRGME
jgi:hypothetical protein